MIPSLDAKPATERELLITRIFNAPREMVFKAWTDPNLARHWWGPREHPAIDLEMDLRPGGVFRCCLQSVETGEKLWHRGVFREILAPHHIVFTFAWEEEGERGLETLVTVTFAEESGKTRMILRQSPFQSDAERDGHTGGWNSVFDRFEDWLRT